MAVQWREKNIFVFRRYLDIEKKKIGEGLGS